jgi:hypothetical protein
MYLAPLCGVGLGVLLTLALRAAFRWRGRRAELGFELAGYVLVLLAFVAVLDQTSYQRRSAPYVTTRLLGSLQEFGSKLPENSVVWHSWSFGYAVQDVVGAATFNDGESPDPVVMYLIAKGLTSREPEDLRRVLCYLSSVPREQVATRFAERPHPEAYAPVAEHRDPPAVNLYVLFTAVSQREFPDYFYRGHYDFQKETGPKEWYDIYRCSWLGRNRIDCRAKDGSRYEMDLSLGLIENQPALRKVVVVEGGRVASETDYPHEGGIYLQIVLDDQGGVYQVQLMRERTFYSNYNQLYVLGRADPELFEEVHADYPVARAFRLR